MVLGPPQCLVKTASNSFTVGSFLGWYIVSHRHKMRRNATFIPGNKSRLPGHPCSKKGQYGLGIYDVCLGAGRLEWSSRRQDQNDNDKDDNDGNDDDRVTHFGHFPFSSAASTTPRIGAFCDVIVFTYLPPCRKCGPHPE